MKDGWVDAALGDICKVTMGQSPPSYTYNEDKKGLPFFQGKAEFSEFHPVVKKWCSNPKKIAEENDILLSVRAPVGAANVAKNKCAIGRGLAAISYPLCYKYIFYYLRSIERKLDEQGTGTTFKAISAKLLSTQTVSLPPLPEQRVIVTKIEQLFSQLDSAFANLQEAKRKLDIYRQAVLKKAFEGELTKEWRKEQAGLVSASEILQELKGSVGTAAGDDEGAALYSLPARWCWVKSGQIINPINNGYTPKSNYLFSGSGDIPFIKVYNLRFDGVLDFSVNPTFIPKEIHANYLRRSVVLPGDILINIVGPPLGKVSMVPRIYSEWNINQAIVLFRPNKYIISEYLCYYFQNPLTVRWLENTSRATAGQYNIRVSVCREIPLPCCSPEEQKQVVREIESRLSICDNIRQSIEESLEKTESLRQSILKKAFEGELLSETELETCRQEPDWEPAELLLERVKSIRSSEHQKKRQDKLVPKRQKDTISRVDYYKRTLLASEIVSQLQKDLSLGHVKLQKLIYLCQESAGMKLPTNFLQQAAGPYDPQMARSIDKQLKLKKWYEYKPGAMLKYWPLERAGEHRKDFEKYFQSELPKIQWIIDLFRVAKSDQIEIVATLYAVWKQMLSENSGFSDDILVKRFYEWSEEKSKFPQEKIQKAITWMKQEGIVPDNQRIEAHQ